MGGVCGTNRSFTRAASARAKAERDRSLRGDGVLVFPAAFSRDAKQGVEG